MGMTVDQPGLGIDFVRAWFPVFSEPFLAGQAFLIMRAALCTCRPVIDRLDRFCRARKVRPYVPFTASQLSGAEMDEARQRLASILGVDTDEVSFGHSTTQNTYVLAQTFRQFLKPGEAIVVTN